MLYWHFRNFQCILLSLFKPRLVNPTASITRRFWANPFDSDWLLVVQAGRYFTYTDAARWELAIRGGFLKPALKNKWVVILGGQKIIYRKPIKIFRTFDLTVQFVGWDEKWIYSQHVFRQGGDVKCVSFSKIGLRGNGRLVSPVEVFNKMGFTEVIVPPGDVLQYFSADLESLDRWR
jgi:acyl-CoA thioesterase FadM